MDADAVFFVLGHPGRRRLLESLAKPYAFHSVRLGFFAAMFFVAVLGRAEDVKAPDPDLPQPFDAGAAKDLLAHSPFSRAVNLAESLRLTGVAFIEGKPVVTVKDSSTNKTYVVSETPNAQGWKLASATQNTEFKSAEAKIMIGPEVVTIRYSESQLAQTKQGGANSKGGYMPSRTPTKEEFTGHDEKGDYVRGMPYLTDEDRSKMRDVPRETREKFLQVVHDQRDMLFKASHEERAAFVKQAFDSVMRR